MTVRNVSVTKRVLLSLVVAGLAMSLAVLAADKPVEKGKAPAAAPAMDEQMKQMMEMMEKMGTPGPQHADLMKLAGKWKVVTKSWMGPGDPMVTEGTAAYKPVLGGRFLMEEVHGVFMDKPFEGMGLTGYDNQHKEYVGTWMDNMGTMIMTSHGSMDASGKVLTMTSEFDDPATGQKSPVRMVTTFMDPNTKKFEMFENHGGQEVRSMEITYTRAK